jgi:predicted TIM-barrel fold metal-dependent hydrolase
MKRTFPLALIILIISAGCHTKYYSMDDYPVQLKIDSHMHIGSKNGNFENIADKDNFILITLNVDHSDSAAIQNQLGNAAWSAKNHPGRVFYGSTFLFDTAGWGTPGWSSKVISQLDRNLSEGAITVKIWKNIGMTVRDREGNFIMADNPGLDPVFKYIRSRNLPVTGHLGEPRNCWLPLTQMTVKGDSSYFAENPQYHMFLHPEYPSYEDQINSRDNLIAKNPDMIFIGCHLGSLEWNVDSLAKRLDRFPDMAVDMSARICHLQYQSARNREKVRDFCIKYQDRLLYGTDIGEGENANPDEFKKNVHDTWYSDWKYFVTDDTMSTDAFKGSFTGLRLPSEVVDKIYRENAIKWYNLRINAR